MEDKFFNSDGELITTSWAEKEREKKRSLDKRNEEMERRQELRRLKDFSEDEKKRIKLEHSHEKITSERRNRNMWLNMPQWVKSLPRTLLSEPPTEGAWNKLVYSSTKKVKLTDNERRKRVSQLKLVEESMDIYNRTHQYLPSSKKTAFVTVVPVMSGSGSSVTVRCLSKAMSESRRDIDLSMSLDFGEAGNDLISWFRGAIESSSLSMRTLLNFIAQEEAKGASESGRVSLTPADTFTPAGAGEVVLPNRNPLKSRAIIGVEQVVSLSEFSSHSPGICFYDCDPNNKSSFAASVAYSSVNIFVLPISSKAPEELERLINIIREINPDNYREALEHSILIVSGLNEKFNEKEGRDITRKVINACSEKVGIPIDRCFSVPYDKALASPPVKWEHISLLTAHQYRKICAMIIESIIQREG